MSDKSIITCYDYSGVARCNAVFLFYSNFAHTLAWGPVQTIT